MRELRIACFVCVVAMAFSPANAQISTGEIFGRVTDGTGAVLPGVGITVSSPALLQPQSVFSATSGGYRFPNPVYVPTGATSPDSSRRSVHTDRPRTSSGTSTAAR
jgi:hypothetical protein